MPHYVVLPRLEFNLGCGAIFVLKRRITKMAPQGATAKYLATRIAHTIDILTVPFHRTDKIGLK